MDNPPELKVSKLWDDTAPAERREYAEKVIQSAADAVEFARLNADSLRGLLFVTDFKDIDGHVAVIGDGETLRGLIGCLMAFIVEGEEGLAP